MTTASLVDGGFDPVAVTANVGDLITSAVLGYTGAITADSTVVPSSKPPAVVRTSPAAGRTDVALSTVIIVVFNEPMDSESVDAGIHLTVGGAPVSGTMAPVGDGAVGRFSFRPSSLLQAFATYELQISGEILDAHGTPLGATTTIEFTTSGTTADPPTGLAINTFRMLEFFDNVDDDYMYAPQLRVSAYPTDSNVRVVAFRLLAVSVDSAFNDPYTCFTDQKIPPGGSRELFGIQSYGDYSLTYSYPTSWIGARFSAVVGYILGDGVTRTVVVSGTVVDGKLNAPSKPTNSVWSHCTLL